MPASSHGMARACVNAIASEGAAGRTEGAVKVTIRHGRQKCHGDQSSLSVALSRAGHSWVRTHASRKHFSDRGKVHESDGLQDARKTRCWYV
ncbi:hypothetical protein L1887_58451 [Cichorium endivia]|nr:hypothetical protein L1887_58451 [Cichorium endivia]